MLGSFKFKSLYSFFIGLKILFRAVIRIGNLASFHSHWELSFQRNITVMEFQNDYTERLWKVRCLHVQLFAPRRQNEAELMKASNSFTSERPVQFSSNHQQKETVIISPTVLSFTTLPRSFRNSSEHVCSISKQNQHNYQNHKLSSGSTTQHNINTRH